MIISTAKTRLATTWKQCRVSFSDFCDELAERLERNEGAETHAEYLAMSKDEQSRLKDVGGFVGGSLRDGVRKRGHCEERWLLTLDLDNAPPDSAEEIVDVVADLGFNYAVYSTRKHDEEHPRLRVILPLDRAVGPDEYAALARAAAQQIDPSMTMWDPTTFEPERLMYWPSRSLDQDTVLAVRFNSADLPVDDALAEWYDFEDWRNAALWPLCPTEQPRERYGDTQTDPRTKEGWVGAFCRAYDVPAAIDKFLPEVYTEAGEGRYTYAAGSTTAGAVLYDDDQFLFSHHSTDPAGGRLLNAWDLVRLHRFGELDAGVSADTPVNRQPSWVAMMEMVMQDPETRIQYTEDQQQRAESALDGFTALEDLDLDTAPGKNDDAEMEVCAGEVNATPDAAWVKNLTYDKKGKLLNTSQNLRVILSNDPRVAGKVWIDSFANRMMARGPFPWPSAKGERVWNDNDDAGLRWWLETCWGITGDRKIQDAINLTAAQYAIDPVVEYLDSLTWDGVPRLDTLFIDWLKADDTPYVRAVTRKVFCAAVARVYEPGTKFDQVVILSGSQGAGKSTIIAKMGRRWFSDSFNTVNGKDAREAIQGVWLVEMGELTAFARSETEAIKQFVSQTKDNYRPAYGRRTEEFPRRCVFFGTSNGSEYLRDTTGNRRFWPVTVHQEERDNHILDAFTPEKVGQVWAEAVVKWRAGEKLYLENELRDVAREVQATHMERDPWLGEIEEFLDKDVPVDWEKWPLERRQLWWSEGFADRDAVETKPRETICVSEIWCEMLHQTTVKNDQRTAKRISGLLAMCPGWTTDGKQTRDAAYGKQRRWHRE